MFKLNRKNGVSYYTITSFEETGLVKHGFSTREGGVSDGCYSSMNFAFTVMIHAKMCLKTLK